MYICTFVHLHICITALWYYCINVHWYFLYNVYLYICITVLWYYFCLVVFGTKIHMSHSYLLIEKNRNKITGHIKMESPIYPFSLEGRTTKLAVCALCASGIEIEKQLRLCFFYLQDVFLLSQKLSCQFHWGFRNDFATQSFIIK